MAQWGLREKNALTFRNRTKGNKNKELSRGPHLCDTYTKYTDAQEKGLVAHKRNGG